MNYIYRITNKLNQKSYIGVSNNPQKRWREHCIGKTKYYSMIHAAIEKYGESNFIFEILEQHIDRETALKREEELISELRTIAPYGYNIHKGGGEPPKQNKISEEAANKIIFQLQNFSISRQSIIKTFKITNSILENINLGNAWKKENLTYPLRPNEHDLQIQRAEKIKQELKYTQKSQKEIASEFGLSKTEIVAINQGKFFYDENEVYPLRGSIVGNKGKSNGVTVVQLLDGKVIQEFESAAEASRRTGICCSSIRKCCRGEQSNAGGYQWKNKTDE